MNKKKILWIGILIIFVVVILILVTSVTNSVELKNSIDNNNTANVGRDTVSNGIQESNTYVTNSVELKNSIDNLNVDKNIVSNDIQESKTESNTYLRKELDDGILYSKTGEKVSADIILGDNYFDTTINDMYLNPDTYKGKKIEIEGFYLSNNPWTFIARYSTSNLCAYCPVGYSYMEYQLDGTIDAQFTDEKEWIKIVGILEVGNDETSYYQDYYYLKVLSLEVMNERGQETVNN